ncbi:MAG: Lrp/AsnC family transcriptional regulator [Betaproteobacteria bacterium]|nr:Lrp/AsnC family transcriptional regulator [Betaproteobacteria bacterium]MDH3435544.1 Lrp/AsnC family transcriptional regulator [Betaproteobacteria bacterium]
MDGLELQLLNDFQRGFPLCPEPFGEIARRCNIDPAKVIGAYRKLAAEGAVSRIGAVFAPNCVGASTLAAMRVPQERLSEVAQCVSAYHEVNHNYEREHDWNLWFVVTAPDKARLTDVLAEIERECGLGVMSLPLEEDFHIDLGFDLRDGTVPARGSRPAVGPLELTADESALVAALQPGIPVAPRPYAELGRRAGMTESGTIAQLQRWLGAGVIRRFGVVVRHHELGFGANAMVVLDVPDPEVGRAGRRLAAAHGVTLCYRRPRALPQWRYNLFCMIHGRSREAVLAQLAPLCERGGLADYPREVLFSCRRFKQRGARYVEEAAHG